jgi:hypothetical protein
MSGQEEHAAGARGAGCFPAGWGTPQGEPGTEERTAWVRRHARLEQALDIDKVEARKIADEIHGELAAERAAPLVAAAADRARREHDADPYDPAKALKAVWWLREAGLL